MAVELVDVKADIEMLVALELKRDAMSQPFKDQIAQLQESMDDLTSGIDMEIAHIRSVVEEKVLETGKSFTDAPYQVIYCKGRETWDTKKLDGFALAHPEILDLKKVGEPYVQWRKGKGK